VKLGVAASEWNMWMSGDYWVARLKRAMTLEHRNA
jgi:hypothetical protein